MVKLIPYSSIYDNIAAMEPPIGEQSDFVNPKSQTSALIAVNSIALLIMLPMLASRFWIRGRLLKNLGWEDYACGIAALGSLAHSTLILYNIRLKLGVHLWNIPISVFMRPRNIRFLTGVSLIYSITICFLKVSILLSYRRSFPSDTLLRRFVYVAIIIFTAIYMAHACVQITVLAECTTWMTITRNPVCQNIFVINVLQSSLNMLTDFFILLLPVGSLVCLQLEKRQKYGLFVVLGLGLVVCMVAAARMALLINTVQLNDPWNSAIIANLSVIELNLGILLACAPALSYLLRPKDETEHKMYLPPPQSYKTASQKSSLPSIKTNLNYTPLLTEIDPSKTVPSRWSPSSLQGMSRTCSVLSPTRARGVFQLPKKRIFKFREVIEIPSKSLCDSSGRTIRRVSVVSSPTTWFRQPFTSWRYDSSIVFK